MSESLMRRRRRRVMLNAASDINCRSVVGAVMNEAAPGALWECQSVRCLGLRVASNVLFRYSCFGLRREARESFCSASC
eukprot:12828915-Prorocentrum_lima.AAC.1